MYNFEPVGIIWLTNVVVFTPDKWSIFRLNRWTFEIILLLLLLLLFSILRVLHLLTLSIYLLDKNPPQLLLCWLCKLLPTPLVFIYQSLVSLNMEFTVASNCSKKPVNIPIT